MRKRRCESCGKDISYRPAHHYLCYDCWRNNNSPSEDCEIIDDYDLISHPYTMIYDPDTDDYIKYNQTYEERYKGDSEYDMGPNWDYDEYPPENL